MSENDPKTPNDPIPLDYGRKGIYPNPYTQRLPGDSWLYGCLGSMGLMALVIILVLSNVPPIYFAGAQTQPQSQPSWTMSATEGWICYGAGISIVVGGVCVAFYYHRKRLARGLILGVLISGCLGGLLFSACLGH